MPSFCNGVSPSSRQEKRLLGGGKRLVARLRGLTVPPPGCPWERGCPGFALTCPTLISSQQQPSSPAHALLAKGRTVRGCRGENQPRLVPTHCGGQERSLACKGWPRLDFSTLCKRHESAIVFHPHGMKRSLDLSSSPRDGGLGT